MTDPFEGMIPEAWMTQGACAPADNPDDWFAAPEEGMRGKRVGSTTQRAISVCRECPIQQQCLEYALEHDEAYGIWGGVTARGRLRLKTGQVADYKIPEAEPAKPEPTPQELARMAPIKHGTSYGVRAHYRRGEKVCHTCATAAAERRAASKLRRYNDGDTRFACTECGGFKSKPEAARCPTCATVHRHGYNKPSAA